MRKLYGILILNAKTLAADKVSFLWTFVLPLFIALVYQRTFMRSLNTEELMQSYISWFWVFIIFASFAHGIGINLTRFRDTGLLKTYVLISGSKRVFVYAALINQFIFCFLNLMIFSTVMAFVYKLDLFSMLLTPALMLVCSIPFAFATLLFTSLPFKHTTISTLVNIGMYPLFLLAINTGQSSWLKWMNPFMVLYKFYQYSALLVPHSSIHVSVSVIPFLFLACYLIAGIYSMRTINLVSRVER